MLTYNHFRMNQVEISETKDEVKSVEEITDLELEVKVEKFDETGDITTEVFEKMNNSGSLKIIGEKRKNKELYSENKKIKQEFVVFEESGYKQEPQEIKEINLGYLNNQVIYTKKIESCSFMSMFTAL
jgi:hypothetical protein